MTDLPPPILPSDRVIHHRLDETADWVAITRLQHAYADVVDRRAWAELGELFLPTTTVSLDLVNRPGREVVGPEAFGDFVGAAMARFEFFEFVILNAHIDLWPDGDRTSATARIFMCELRTVTGSTTRDDAFGLYRDRYVKVDDRWWIAERRYRSMGRFPEGVVFPLDEG